MSDHEDAAEVIDQLYQRIGEGSPQPRLQPTRRAVELLGDPQRMYGIVHITGSNGKTSTARIIDSLLRAHGLRVGVMTSPHLTVLNERIVIDGEPISDEALVANYNDIEPFLYMVDMELEAQGEQPLTFFEALTVLAFACFADAPVDVAVVEVGMGGEWDSTNVANADVAVFSPIGLEHVDRLGPTLVDIAKTKSGIIKPASRVVSAGQSPEVMDVLLDASEKNEAPLFVLGRDFHLRSITPGVGGQVIDLEVLSGSYPQIALPLLGNHQADNAAVALAAVEQFLGGGEHHLEREVVEDGLAQSSSPGRLQVIATEPTILVDAAHNPHGAEALSRAVMSSFQFDTLVVVLGVLGDKDARGIVEALDPVADYFVVTQPSSERARDVADLADTVSQLAGPDRTSWRGHLSQAIELAKEQAGPTGGVLITGSAVMVGEAMDIVKGPQS
jgi:dihydrofolate synthase/folylpolyglutamate synthase